MDDRNNYDTPEINDDNYLTKDLDNEIVSRPLYHNGIVKNNAKEAVDDLSNEWAGGSLLRPDIRLQDVARLEHDIRYIENVEAPRMAANILTNPTKWHVTGQTTYTTRSGSTYMVDWEEKLIKGSSIPGGEKPFKAVNDFYNQDGQHFINSDSNRLEIVFEDGSHIKTSPIVDIRDDTVTRVPVNIEQKVPLTTELNGASGFNYEVDWAAKTINGQRFKAIVNAPTSENNYTPFNNRILDVHFENGDIIHESIVGGKHSNYVTVDEFKQIENKIREQERESHGQVFHTISGSTYILDRDRNVFYKDGYKRQYPIAESGEIKFRNDGRLYVEVEGGHIVTSPVTRTESLSDYKRSFEREDLGRPDISQGINDDLER